MSDGAFRIKSGDTLPALRVILKDANGKVAIVNTGDVVRFRMTPAKPGGSADVDAVASVNDGAKGDVEYRWPGGAPAPGLYRGEFHVVYQAGGTATFPGGDEYISILIGHPASA